MALISECGHPRRPELCSEKLGSRRIQSASSERVVCQSTGGEEDGVGQDPQSSQGPDTNDMVFIVLRFVLMSQARSCLVSRPDGWRQYSHRPDMVSSVGSCLSVSEIRCSPFQWLGPARFTQPPCPITSLPPIDIVIISQYSRFPPVWLM